MSSARNSPIERGERRSSRRSDAPKPGRSMANRRARSASVAHIEANAGRHGHLVSPAGEQPGLGDEIPLRRRLRRSRSSPGSDYREGELHSTRGRPTSSPNTRTEPGATKESTMTDELAVYEVQEVDDGIQIRG